MNISDKKDWAKLLFVKEGLSQKEIAAKTGVSAVSINKWVKIGHWDLLKQSMLVTRSEQLNRLYMQLQELNAAILKRPEGERYANSKDADVISKLTTSIRTMETEASIADIVEVCKRLLGWIRVLNPEKAKELADIFDDFIRDQLKR